VFEWQLFRTFQAHPREAVLLAGTRAADPDVARHLADCPACAARAAEADAVWDRLREAAAAEADAAFTDTRLARQRAAVLRRLDPEAQPARVLTFPHAARQASPARRVAMRWVAAAAVAGLALGVSAGRVLDRWPRGAGAPGVQAGPATGAPHAELAVAVNGATDAVTDEAWLAAISAAPLTPSIEPLHVLDEMTPRAAEWPSPDR
jgi:anti-sigma factor RsiW